MYIYICSNSYNSEAQQDSFECLLLLMDIMDKGFAPYFTDEYMKTSYSDSLSEPLFSIILVNYIVCHVC